MLAQLLIKPKPNVVDRQLLATPLTAVSDITLLLPSIQATWSLNNINELDNNYSYSNFGVGPNYLKTSNTRFPCFQPGVNRLNSK